MCKIRGLNFEQGKVRCSTYDIVDNFQSAYKAGHSCETALLRVYNDIVTTIGKGNGAMLVLLDLSAAFDTIDHDNLFLYS